jgi:hypothetical protein
MIIRKRDCFRILFIACRNKNAGCSCQLGLVENANCIQGRGIAVGLNDDGHVVSGKQTLDGRSNAGDSDFAPSVVDLSCWCYRDEDAVLLEVTLRSSARLVDLYSSLFNKDGRDDEEDQEDENHIDQRRDIDLAGRFGSCFSESLESSWHLVGIVVKKGSGYFGRRKG